MEESKELQGFYKIFRAVIYISVLMEFFEYAIDLAMLDHWGGILIDIHGRIKRSCVQQDCDVPAYLHHLYRYEEQEASGVRCPETGVISANQRTVPDCVLRVVVPSSDGNEALHVATKYHLLHGDHACRCDIGTYRTG